MSWIKFGIARKAAFVLIGTVGAGAPGLAGCAVPAGAPSITELDAAIRKLRPLYHCKVKPKPGEWLSLHHEDGQTFHQYLASHPVLPQGDRRVIYIQPLGGFSP